MLYSNFSEISSFSALPVLQCKTNLTSTSKYTHNCRAHLNGTQHNGGVTLQDFFLGIHTNSSWLQQTRLELAVGSTTDGHKNEGSLLCSKFGAVRAANATTLQENTFIPTLHCGFDQLAIHEGLTKAGPDKRMCPAKRRGVGKIQKNRRRVPVQQALGCTAQLLRAVGFSAPQRSQTSKVSDVSQEFLVFSRCQSSHV